MKKYIPPRVEFEDIEEAFVLRPSQHLKPGWGPDKDSDEDGHSGPPGKRNGLDFEQKEDIDFEFID